MMRKRLTIAALLLAVAPTLAFAYCDEMRRKPDGTLCPAETIYDGEFALCVEVPSG